MALLTNFDTTVIKVVLAIHLQGDIRYGMSRGKHCSCTSLMSVCRTKPGIILSYISQVSESFYEHLRI